MNRIDRDAVVYKVKSCITIPADNEWDSGYNTAMAEVKQYIQNAQAVNRWIPCSERLPEDNAEVLVSFFRRYVKIGYIEPGDGLRYWVIPGHSVVPLNYIEAWMPIPDAYEPTEKEVK